MARWKEDQYEYTLYPEVMWKESPNGKYWVSERGDLISKFTGYTLTVKPQSNGYHVTCKADVGESSLHRIIYTSFVGKIPKGMQINHLDGNKSNNHLSNLELCTPSENVLHAFRLGLNVPQKGELNGNVKVKEEDVLKMYSLFKLGYNNQHIGDMFGLHDRYVSLIRHGRRWTHLWDSEGMTETTSLGSLKYPLAECVYIYNKCMTSDKPQGVLGEELGIDSSQVSRIRTGKTWKHFRNFFGVPHDTPDWRTDNNPKLVQHKNN